jgi:hypothetical protein
MKRILLIIGCMSVIATATPQKNKKYKYDKNEHELLLYGVGGSLPVPYTVSDDGKKGGNFGGGAGLEYICHFNSSFGIVTGFEMADYRSKASFGSVADEYDMGTGKNLMRFSYALTDFEERQSLIQFSVPVMVQYSLPLGDYSPVSLYAAGGLKLGFPLKAKTHVTRGTITTSGYYPYENIEYSTLPQHGFFTDASLPAVTEATLTDDNRNVDFGFLTTMLALDVGARFSLTDKIGLYTGLYFDYRINMESNRNRRIVEYNESAVVYNSILNTGLTSRANMVSIGLKVKIGLKL